MSRNKKFKSAALSFKKFQESPEEESPENGQVSPKSSNNLSPYEMKGFEDSFAMGKDSPELDISSLIPDMSGFRDLRDEDQYTVLIPPDLDGFNPPSPKNIEDKKVDNKNSEIIDREKLLDEIFKNLSSLNVRAVIFDFDFTLLKISSDEYYPTKGSAARRIARSGGDTLKLEHTNKETLKNEWFADLDFLTSFLEICQMKEIKTAIISDQLTVIISDVIKHVGLQDLFNGIFGKNSYLDNKDRRISVLNKAKELIKEDEFCLYLDDSESNIDRLKNDKTIITHHVFSGDEDASKNGLNLNNWNLVNETLKKMIQQKTQSLTTSTKPSPDFELTSKSSNRENKLKKRKESPTSIDRENG